MTALEIKEGPWSPAKLKNAADELVAEGNHERAEALKTQIVAGFFGKADAWDSAVQRAPGGDRPIG